MSKSVRLKDLTDKISFGLTKNKYFCCIIYCSDWQDFQNQSKWLVCPKRFQHLLIIALLAVETRVAAFQGMHVSPAKHCHCVTTRKCDYRTDTHIWTDRQIPDKVIPMGCYASQATQLKWHWKKRINCQTTVSTSSLNTWKLTAKELS